MKDRYQKSKVLPILFATLAMAVAANIAQPNISFGQAVDLIPIQTGNATLDKGLPEFYDCIDEKIDASKGVEEDPYFEKEPTKHEVSTCYNEVFLLNVDAQSNDDVDAQSNDDVDAQSNDDVDAQSNDELINSDIERFNSLFGIVG
jgi:hypothetical protein